MFELGWLEIGIIGVIALVVLGPERMPKAARFAGLWVRKARAQWFAVKSEMERELAAEELKASLQAERDSIRDAVKQLDNEARELHAGVRDATRVHDLPDASSDAGTEPKPPTSLPPPNP
jgi:sec-independent protein translocase protein TatB